jgi:hypothetical protein
MTCRVGFRRKCPGARACCRVGVGVGVRVQGFKVRVTVTVTVTVTVRVTVRVTVTVTTVTVRLGLRVNLFTVRVMVTWGKPRPEVTGMTPGVCENVQSLSTCMSRHSTPGLRVKG